MLEFRKSIRLVIVKRFLRYYEPKIWNSLSFYAKAGENLKTFKDIIKNWNDSTCN